MSLSPDSHSFCQNKNHVAPTVDSEREEFRKYLESHGVLDVLTRFLEDLYIKESKPKDPLNFLTIALGALNYDAREIASLKDELRDLQIVIKNLEEENLYLKEKLEKFQSIIAMVRVKYRYILAEIVPEAYKHLLKLPLKENDLKKAILDNVQETHGDYGLACISPGFSMKMYNPATRVFILRVRRNFHSILGTTLPMITSVGKFQLTIRTLHLSGTIRCAYKCLIDHDKEKLKELVGNHQLSEGIKDELASMIGNCQNRLAKRRLDVK